MYIKPIMLLKSGLPASGKSYSAKAWVAQDPNFRRRINWDDLRLDLFGEGWKFNRKEEQEMKETSYDICRNDLSYGNSVVIDNTNLTESTRNKWKSIAGEFGVEVIEEEHDTPVAICVERDRQRVGSSRVGRAVIERLALFYGFINWEECLCGKVPMGFDLIIGTDGKYHRPQCYLAKKYVICDIDTTVSNLDHRLHLVKPAETKCGSNPPEDHTYVDGKCWICGNPKPKKDWVTFHTLVDKDPPIPEMVELVRYLAKKYHILFITGRGIDNGCGVKTEDWLDKHIGRENYLHLFMRQAGDNKNSAETKKEMLDLLMPKERIAFVLDDASKVVSMWREQGLRCLQVAPTDY